MIKLFSTEGCHLCEQAYAMLLELGVRVEVVDIAFDEELFARYGVTIPVVNFEGKELNWPFTLQTLNSWLETNGITNNS